ncbi:MAG: hypothetical protein U0R52_04165 [Solirubrobacterales bacterium]
MLSKRSALLAGGVACLALIAYGSGGGAIASSDTATMATAERDGLPRHGSGHIDPADFRRGGRVTNRWFPLKPGSVYRYRGSKDGKPAVEVLRVTRRTKRIQGVTNSVISDKLYLKGRLAERTLDWYTQDRRGNVWYFGENTATIAPGGRVISREGSFQAGRDGARPGIFMPAHPRVGQRFQQEFYKGHAEDRFRIVDLSAGVSVPFVTTRKAMRTVEWTPLEPGILDAKLYVRGIGTVAERQLRGEGPPERLELVSFRRG